MLKAYGYIKTGHPTRNVLTSQEQEIPEVGPDQILVRVKAAAINPVDAQLANTPNEDLKGQFKSLGFDYSGEVIKVGSDVAKSGFQGLDLKAGTNVFGLPLNMYTQSTLATHLLLGSSDPQAICIKPDNMSHALAASIPLVFLTSFTAMCRDAKLGDHTGELSVAVIGASGGTGIYGVNVAKHYYKAAKVVGVCSSRNVDFVKGLGADVVVDYTKGDPLTRLVEEGPFDLVYDCVGGTQWFDRLDKLVKPSGYFLTIVGDKTDRSSMGGPFTMGDAAKERRDRGLAGKAPKYDNVMLAAESKYLQEALTLHKQGKLPLEVDSVFPFTDDGVKDAFDKLDTARVRGKVVIKLES